ncbi:MAG: AtpZ/AtpI family protein [Fibrobacteria bacterium]
MTKSSPASGNPEPSDPRDEEPVAPMTAKARAEGTSNQWLAYLNLGWLMVANLVVFVGGGFWADKHFGTAPILLLVGVFLGFTGCGYTIYRAVKNIEHDEAAKPRN